MNLKGLFAGLIVLAAGAASAQVDIIVRLVRPTDASYVATRYGILLVDRMPGTPFALYRAKNKNYASIIEPKMAIDPRIVWIEEDDEYTTPEGQGLKGAPYKGSTLPAVGDRSVLYKGNSNVLTQINFDKTAAATTGRTVRVAIIDTGLAPTQSYLWAKVDYSINFVEDGEDAYDIKKGYDSNGDGIFDAAVGHGTMVAGIIDQIAPRSRYTIIRVADSDGVGSAWGLIKGLGYAVSTGCEIANVSMGSLNDLPAMSDVMDWCEEKNLLVVASMGNDGVRDAAFPARISKVIAVGGLLPDNTKAPFSNWDSKCDFSAPATGIISQWYDGQIGVWSGTSFAAPMVAGAIADGLKKVSRMPVGVLRDRIDKVGRNIDDLNPDYDGEIGVLLDVKRLVSAVRGGA
ncbi:MAG: S8 family serine peptidase [Fimbriimonas sp.]